MNLIAGLVYAGTLVYSSDTNRDGTVDAIDLLRVLHCQGVASPCCCDADCNIVGTPSEPLIEQRRNRRSPVGDGLVNELDIAEVMSDYGKRTWPFDVMQQEGNP